MSLRAFHIIFIIISVLLFTGIAVWALLLTREEGTAITLLGAGCSAVAVLLVGYGVYFVRKARNIIV